METVTLEMTDENGKKHERTIDISNAMVARNGAWELGGPGSQRDQLEEWIQDRALEQHGVDYLELNDWTINAN